MDHTILDVLDEGDEEDDDIVVIDRPDEGERVAARYVKDI
jgi:hypothetical protein